ncbi:ATP phosphoribosyltransferase regulatory subunit [Spiribacter roseus]|uniref:ATP phosphoribosyltransferase regulatory subunit n=1 Tax=Spiribacter roseus TaxID=1855875 RepID=A0ABV3RZ26_9GAMM
MTDRSPGPHSPWLLPDSVEELLPPAAAALEHLRQSSLERCARWGYELVMPPVIEYLEALLSGVAHDLDLQTFKLTDQMSGRMMGVRADITPQAARIDAHQLRREGPVRLCYSGTVLRTRAEGGEGSRNPLQMGAELYGHGGIESDVEVIGLMAEILSAAGIEPLHVDLGHVGIFRGLCSAAGLEGDAEARLWDALQRKSTADIEALLGEFDVAPADHRRLSALAGLSGGAEVLTAAAEALAGAGEPVDAALEALTRTAEALAAARPDMTLHFDLGELRGYRYHTGIVFAAYTPGVSGELARGGRYDDIGAVFGRGRPATGFSADLKALRRAAAMTTDDLPGGGAIAAPWSADEALRRRVAALREAGETVIWALPGHPGAAAGQGCNRQLVQAAGGDWQIETIEPAENE